MDLYTKMENGKRSRLSKREILKQLEYIWNHGRANRKVNNVAALTAEPRSLWAKVFYPESERLYRYISYANNVYSQLIAFRGMFPVTFQVRPSLPSVENAHTQ